MIGVAAVKHERLYRLDKLDWAQPDENISA